MPTKKFVVTRLKEEHDNHPMPDELQDHYPEFRHPPAEAKKAAREMLETDVEARHIRAKVASFGKKVTRQDIQNLRYVLGELHIHPHTYAGNHLACKVNYVEECSCFKMKILFQKRVDSFS